MERVDIDDLEPSPFRESRRELTDPLGATDVAVNVYRVDPGEVLSGSMHAHHDQEELFVVVSGTATFETPEETVEVGPRGAIRFAPGEFQQGRNEGDEPLTAVAIGAPPDSREIESLVECRECGERTRHTVERADGEFVLTCTNCGNVI